MLKNTLSLLFMLATVLACTTTPPPPAKKPHDKCICGPLQNDRQESFCAIWGTSSRLDAPQAVYEAKPHPTCLPRDCSQFFSAFCQQIQMAETRPSGPPTPLAGRSLCFCDQILIENDRGQVQLVCAAWREGDPHLIEYYATDTCSTQRCAAPPFHRTARQCPDGFRSFYLPLQNRR